jgi:hypothetical protein
VRISLGSSVEKKALSRFFLTENTWNSQGDCSTIVIEQNTRFPQQPVQMTGGSRDHKGTLSLETPALPADLIASAFLR